MQASKPATKVYEELKKRIIVLQYQPGQPLPIKKIAEEFGVSSTPVREALIHLNAEGLVRLVPNSSAYVSEVSFQELKDVFEVRLVLVEKAGELAACRIKERDLLKMRCLISDLERSDTRDTLINLDSELHELINNATGNRVLAKTLAHLRSQSIRLWFFIQDQSKYIPRLIDDHQRFYEALRRRDGRACAQILRDHVLHFVDLVRDELLLQHGVIRKAERR